MSLGVFVTVASRYWRLQYIAVAVGMLQCTTVALQQGQLSNE